ncbi:GTP-binding protein Era-like-protein [Spirochaeta thermophila DSM 6578]|uniref:GTPase Era n=1 Tax=Winmispira thermophila (strain ATCC 700085 / DSM 6578 / Z-1203) TaxID=869211 RepID=G0G9V3_WINT7|nr:GTPase Era [Spirochaeta thermophila]AEJ60853.1 GTP-binding protein Era-like-protein [Spirochaeta thermophila DSM 6578]
MKVAVCAIVGRPSSGKSTLLNTLCGRKVAITSPVPQTTRNRIRGIVTEERGQIVFIDTPGYHHSEKKFNLFLKEQVIEALKEVDEILYLVDSTRSVGEEEHELIELVKQAGKPVVIALNKIDIPEHHAEGMVPLLKAHFPSAPIVKISAYTGEGLEELKARLFEAAEEGPQLYPEEFYTDQEPRFRIAEIIREKAIHQTREELPHALYVEVLDVEERPDETLWARALICVERESQKGIIIGKGGEKIKTIRLQSEKELSGIFERPVRLDLRVKVVPKWRRNEGLLRRLLT